MLKSLVNKMFGRDPQQMAARQAYFAIVAQARQPWFYADLGVPDTVTGRFDMITLHSFMVFERLRTDSAKSGAFPQILFDEMFSDMDRSLREMGVGDLSVGKKIRKMAEAYYGRCEAYRTGLADYASDGGRGLKEAFERNIFSAEAETADAAELAAYTARLQTHLEGLPADQIIAGELSFPNAQAKDAV